MNGDRLFLLAIILVIIDLTVVPIVMIFGSVQSGLPGTWTPLTFENTENATKVGFLAPFVRQSDLQPETFGDPISLDC